MTIYERTEMTAKKRGLTMPEVEKKAGLGEKSIYSWKRSTPKADNLKKVADVLNVSTDYLLERTEQMNSYSSPEKQKDLKYVLENDPALAFDGKPISEKYKRVILELLSEESD
ncbi:helix-turn-helix domain-containing protein [Leuconostoc suionicum]|uniref:helix-turn-helix domain-containing protein n=1 Tax=Leuconostoc suionicum TaxID=1511761 RepID=UPI003748BF47